MATNKTIAGLTIEIGADTTKLGDALKGIDNSLRTTKAALSDVNKLLKMDPSNITLLTEKQKDLKSAIDATKDRLKTLKSVQTDSLSPEAYDALQREIISTEQELDKLKKAYKGFGSVSGQVIKVAGEKIKETGKKIADVGKNVTTKLTMPILAVGTASVAAWKEVDDGLDTITTKTGASGEALEDMQKRAKNLAMSIPTDFATAGSAIGEVNTRFGLTGDALEKLSGKFIKFAALNNTDVSSSVDNVQAAMAAFSVSGDKAGDVLDILNKAAQDTGVDVNKLTGDLTSNAAALQEMGFNINSATGFLANLNKNGMDSSTVLTGMKKALQNATKNGESMSSAVNKMENSIKNAKNRTEALKIATELFGSKAAPAMVDAIQEGRISFEELANAVQEAGDSVDNTFEETMDPIDSFKTALNELKIIGAELVDAAAPMIQFVADAVKNAISTIRSNWESLSPHAKETVIKLAGIVAAIGPVITVIGKVVTGIGGVVSAVGTMIGAVGGLLPGGLIVVGLITAGTLITKHWDEIKAWAVDTLIPALKQAWEDYSTPRT